MSEPETAPAIAASLYVEALTAIRDEIRGIIDGSIKPEGHDAASRIAWLAKHASQVAAEQRKAEAAELAAARKLTHTQVLLYLRQQSREYRDELVREVLAIDTEERRSVLG